MAATSREGSIPGVGITVTWMGQFYKAHGPHILLCL